MKRMLFTTGYDIGIVKKYGIDFKFFEVRMGLVGRAIDIYGSKGPRLRDYGEFRNFSFHDVFKATTISALLIDDSRTDVLNAPDFEFRSPDDLSKLYGISHESDTLVLSRYTYTNGGLLKDEVTITSLDDFNTIKSEMDDARVIGLYVKMAPVYSGGRYLSHSYQSITKLLLLVEDEKTRERINKVMFIVDRAKEYLQQNHIPLRTVIENLDLYYCLSYGL